MQLFYPPLVEPILLAQSASACMKAGEIKTKSDRTANGTAPHRQTRWNVFVCGDNTRQIAVKIFLGKLRHSVQCTIAYGRKRVCV